MPTARDDELTGRGSSLTLACGLAATSWGSGPTVLVAHGWESRRTHWGAFVTPMVEAGFRVVGVDAPAHGDYPGEGARSPVRPGAVGGRAQAGPLAGVVGHSFGAGAAVIALHRGLKSERAVLISGPSSVVSVIERRARHDGVPEDDIPSFVRLVEQEVGEPVDHLDVTRIVPGLTARALVVHDKNDKEIPVADGLAVAGAWNGAKVLITERFGHRRIMIASEVVRAVVEFLGSG